MNNKLSMTFNDENSEDEEEDSEEIDPDVQRVVD